MESEVDGDTNCDRRTQINPDGLIKGLEDLVIRRQIDPIQTLASRSAKIQRRGDLLSLRLQ